MPLVDAKCPNCGGGLRIESDKKAAVCPYCKEAYIVQDAINYYVTNNYSTTNIEHLHADVVNVSGNQDFVIKAGTLMEYNGASSDVIIPEGVARIDEHTFKDCIGLTSVTFPQSIQIVSGFSGCVGLKEIALPENVVEIGDRAFSDCVNLSSVVLPRSLQKIGNDAFKNCKALVHIDFPNGLQVIGGDAFADCSSLTEIVIPDSVTALYMSAFSNCTALKKVQLSNSLQMLAYGTFGRCDCLQEITIPGSVETIQGDFDIESGHSSGAFNLCNSLKKVILLPGVRTVGLTAFGYCPIEEITIPDGCMIERRGYRAEDWMSTITIQNVHASEEWKRKNYDTFSCLKDYIPPEVARERKRSEQEYIRAKNRQKRIEKGCYVATAVYGSYDCPEVWTLRRYRDNTLAETWYGRAFIKLYYAVSPTVVKCFGNTKWFNHFFRGRLDRFVTKLKAKGYEDTPYHD